AANSRVRHGFPPFQNDITIISQGPGSVKNRGRAAPCRSRGRNENVVILSQIPRGGARPHGFGIPPGKAIYSFHLLFHRPATEPVHLSPAASGGSSGSGSATRSAGTRPDTRPATPVTTTT